MAGDGRPYGASVDIPNDRMTFLYPEPLEHELHILRFESPTVIMHGAFEATHIYRGHPLSASARKVYIAELKFTFGTSMDDLWYGTIHFPMWSSTYGGRVWRMPFPFENEDEGYRWLEADVIPSL